MSSKKAVKMIGIILASAGLMAQLFAPPQAKATAPEFLVSIDCASPQKDVLVGFDGKGERIIAFQMQMRFIGFGGTTLAGRQLTKNPALTNVIEAENIQLANGDNRIAGGFSGGASSATERVEHLYKISGITGRYTIRMFDWQLIPVNSTTNIAAGIVDEVDIDPGSCGGTGTAGTATTTGTTTGTSTGTSTGTTAGTGTGSTTGTGATTGTTTGTTSGTGTGTTTGTGNQARVQPVITFSGDQVKAPGEEFEITARIQHSGSQRISWEASGVALAENPRPVNSLDGGAVVSIVTGTIPANSPEGYIRFKVSVGAVDESYEIDVVKNSAAAASAASSTAGSLHGSAPAEAVTLQDRINAAQANIINPDAGLSIPGNLHGAAGVDGLSDTGPKETLLLVALAALVTIVWKRRSYISNS
ncbi:MAG: hypothetical protein Q8P95_02715 [bacterium]|nr:hypothetical protein [bacterium]